MNKETENKELEPILKKLSDMEELLKGLVRYIDSFVVPAVGARVDGLMQILNNEIKNYVLELQKSGYANLRKSIRFAVLATTISVFVGSFWGGVASLVMALVSGNSLYWLSWMFFASACVAMIASVFFGCRYKPSNIRTGLKGLEDRINKLYEEESTRLFDGFINEVEFAINVRENDIKREQAKESPDTNVIEGLKREIAEFKEKKADYERSK